MPRQTHYRPPEAELRNHEWCGTWMSLDSESTSYEPFVTCGRCRRKMAARRASAAAGRGERDG